jgi:hypothetical protein
MEERPSSLHAIIAPMMLRLDREREMFGFDSDKLGDQRVVLV